MNTQVFPQGSEKLKSYWSRPGGKFGTVIGILGVIAVGYFVLPILTSVVWNTINFALACAAKSDVGGNFLSSVERFSIDS